MLLVSNTSVMCSQILMLLYETGSSLTEFTLICFCLPFWFLSFSFLFLFAAEEFETLNHFDACQFVDLLFLVMRLKLSLS